MNWYVFLSSFVSFAIGWIVGYRRGVSYTLNRIEAVRRTVNRIYGSNDE